METLINIKISLQGTDLALYISQGDALGYDEYGFQPKC